ncbi:hypothetical protein LTS18_013256, partial [Coniosporium uncinatum]
RFDAKANKSNWIIPSALAFVSQQPWIENATFKDNVLFGLPYDADRYNKVLEACALEKDLHILSDGDATEIGANGINLSGGQRWRITLARAMYSRAGILCFDDIFSAVDAHVGKQIFEEALTGELSKGRTRILVTHHVGLCLLKTKYQVKVGDGKVDFAGSVAELQETGQLEELLKEDEEAIEETDDVETTDNAGMNGNGRKFSSATARRMSKASRRFSVVSGKSALMDESQPIADSKRAQPKAFVEEEKRDVGWVKFRIYSKYLRASGGLIFWVFILFVFVAYQGLLLARSWILRLWTEDYKSESAVLLTQARILIHQTTANYRTTQVDDSVKFYLSLYLGLAVLLCLLGTFRYFLVFFASIKASRNLFEALTHTILRAPLRWLDTVPVGRVLNRFTADFNTIDSMLGQAVAFMLFNALVVVGIIVAGVLVSPYFIIFAAMLLVICLRYAVYYLSGAREAKRLESVAKSPLFELFSTALAG